ncbi:MAG: RNA polymerase sigma factor [Tepidisphaeraceae bacterium]
MRTDQALLQQFVDMRDQPAFTELVNRHVHFVYATARRQCPDEADDVTQAVFILLAQKAASLTNTLNLAGWLYRTALLCSSNVRKLAGRRHRHEREASMQVQTSAPTSSTDATLLALLDDALRRLPESIRDAVLVKHLEGRTAEEAGTLLGVTTDAASKRASRGIQMLRDFFAAKGHAVPVATVGALVVAESATTAPAGVVAAVTTGGGSALALALTSGAGVMAKLAAACAVALIAGAAVTLVALGRPSVQPVAAIAPAPPVVSAPTTRPIVPSPAAEAAVEGDTVFCRYGLVLEGPVLDQIIAKTTETKDPHVRRGAASDIADVLRSALDDGRVFSSRGGLFHETRFANENPPRPHAMFLDQIWQDIRLPPLAYTIGFTSVTAPTFTFRDDHAVDFRYQDLAAEAFSQEYSNQPRERKNEKVAIDYTGTIAPGEVAVVTHDYGDVVGHRFGAILVFQAYRATDEQAKRLRGIRAATTWIDIGPSGARALADRAAKWANGRTLKPADVPDEWTRLLNNGATVRLLATGRPAKWPFCWWDADGKPVAANWTDLDVGLSDTRAVVFDYEGVDDRARSDNVFAIPARDTRVDVWVGAGAFTEQPIKLGEAVKLGDGVVKFTKVMPGNTTLALLRGDLGPDIEVWIDGVTDKGERIAGDGTRAVQLVASDYKRWMHVDENLWTKDKKLDQFILRCANGSGRASRISPRCRRRCRRGRRIEWSTLHVATTLGTPLRRSAKVVAAAGTEAEPGAASSTPETKQPPPGEHARTHGCEVIRKDELFNTARSRSADVVPEAQTIPPASTEPTPSTPNWGM